MLVKAHGFRYGHAHAVLEKHKYRDREEEAEKEPAAVLDDAKAGHQAMVVKKPSMSTVCSVESI